MIKKQNNGYLGNPRLKQIGEHVEYTQFQIDEYAKCSVDPIYFLENYAKIVSLDDGIVPFKLFPYQEKMIKSFNESRFSLCKLFRQSGKSSTVAGYMAWYALFNDNKNSVILANKMATAKEIFSRVQFIIESCPKWLQQGIKEWNKTKFELENGSKVSCAATSASAVRGHSINLLALDEYAFLTPSLAEEFNASVFPTISSAESSKMIIVSTPNGMNHFYKLWVEAEQGINKFVPITTHWSDHPKRNQEWADEQRVILGDVKFFQEIECQFSGSSHTLVAGEKIAQLPVKHGTEIFPNYIEYEAPKRDEFGKVTGNYVITVDTSRGADLDYSAFTVIDINQIPYKVVARYRNNSIAPLMYPEVIFKVGTRYNNAFVLIETNDLGQQVADILFYDLEYENVYMSIKDKIKEGGGNKKTPGIRTTKRTKSIGCSQLKTLIESDHLEVNDLETISELSTFIRKGTSYAADDGKHDDLTMCIHREASIYTEDGIKNMKWIVDTKYSGRVMSLDKNNNFVWAKVIDHMVRPNTNKTWLRLRGKSRNTLICTSDHKVATVDDVFNPSISYVEAKDMLGRYNVMLPGKRFHQTNPIFNNQQISALVGIMLGDGSISKNGKFYCAHRIDQKDYVMNKIDVLNGSLRISPARGRSKDAYWCDVGINEQTRLLREMLYVDGVKTPKNIIHMIDEISIAYWYMDDGHLYNGRYAMLCTDSFTYEDHVQLQKMFSEKFNITPRITKNTNCRTKKTYYRLIFGADSRKKFFELISPFIHESMRYKLPEEYRLVEFIKINNIPYAFGCEKITSIRKHEGPGTLSKLYDITVENNHNFVANGMLVHNCLVLFAFLTQENVFKELFDFSLRQEFVKKQIQEFDDYITPIGFVDRGEYIPEESVNYSPTSWVESFDDFTWNW